MIKQFMDDVMDGGIRAFFITFGIGILLLILTLFLVSCRGPVEFYPIQDSWVNPFSDTPISIEDVCGACGVDHQLLVAAGRDLNGCYQTIKEW